MRVALVAAPLMARSGVHRSAHDLVAAARARGLPWTALLGMRPDAAGAPIDAPGVTETMLVRHGVDVLREVHRAVHADPDVRRADVVVSLVPQSDMVVAASRALRHSPRVAWVRGLPWPAAGEQRGLRRRLLTALESRALRTLDDVWATSPLLAGQVSRARVPAIVPAGVPGLPRTSHGDQEGPLVWAGRLSVEKGPGEYLDLVRRVGGPARLHGSGPMEDGLRRRRIPGLDWAGWLPAERLWRDAGIAVTTSYRDAFGRSPVEAASAGVPVLLSDGTGAAPALYVDPELRRRFVLPLGDHDAWDSAVRDLRGDADLRRRVSDHVHANASELTIERSLDHALQRLRALAPHLHPTTERTTGS